MGGDLDVIRTVGLYMIEVYMEIAWCENGEVAVPMVL